MRDFERKLKKTVQRLGRPTVNRLGVAATRAGLPVPFFGRDSALSVGVAGRTSGKYRLTPMGYVRLSPGKLHVVAEHGIRSDWVKNALAAKTVDVWVGGRKHAAKVSVRKDLDPALVRLQMKGRLLAAANKALSYHSAVVELTLL